MARPPEFIVEKSTLKSTSETIRRLTITNRINRRDSEACEPHIAVFGNGAFGSVRTFGPIIRGYLRAATAQNRPAQAVMYFDPWLGSGTYASSYRTERLWQITKSAADARKVHLVGHSWSWPGAVAIAGGSPDLLDTLTGYTPIGLRGEAITPGLRGLARATLKEALRTNTSVPAEISRATGTLAVTASWRFAFSHAYREALGAMKSDVIDQVLAVRQQGLPVGVALAQTDAFFNVPMAVRERLEDGGVLICDLPTTHGGAVTQPEYGASLYNLTDQLLAKPPIPG